MDTVARGEMVESDLDSLIRGRGTNRRQTEGERLTEEFYESSVRAYNVRQEAARQAERYEYHRGQPDGKRRIMGELITRHEAAAASYLQDEPKGAA